MEAGIDPTNVNVNEVEENNLPEIDLETKLESRKVHHNLKRWIIYPEDPYKSGWDVVTTM